MRATLSDSQSRGSPRSRPLAPTALLDRSAGLPALAGADPSPPVPPCAPRSRSAVIGRPEPRGARGTVRLPVYATTGAAGQHRADALQQRALDAVGQGRRLPPGRRPPRWPGRLQRYWRDADRWRSTIIEALSDGDPARAQHRHGRSGASSSPRDYATGDPGLVFDHAPRPVRARRRTPSSRLSVARADPRPGGPDRRSPGVARRDHDRENALRERFQRPARRGSPSSPGRPTRRREQARLDARRYVSSERSSQQARASRAARSPRPARFATIQLSLQTERDALVAAGPVPARPALDRAGQILRVGGQSPCSTRSSRSGRSPPRTGGLADPARLAPLARTEQLLGT